MKLKIEHITTFSYEEPVYETATEVRLMPVSREHAGQRCLDYTLQINPQATIFRYEDCYGNMVEHFNLLSSHKQLTITAQSLIETGLPQSVDPENPIRLVDYSLGSQYIKLDDDIQKFAVQYHVDNDPYNTANNITKGILESFVYVPGVTGVHSTSADVLQLKQGVCQDFAHVMIAACRSLGLPARYVSGYFYGGEGTEGEDRASHAWCEVYCGDTLGWKGFDPTHDTLYPDERYIKIGVGRDYDDIPPVRGTYKGVSGEKLSVVVRITDIGRTLSPSK